MNLREDFGERTPAIVLAEGKVGEPGGKTAHGVILHSDIFDVGAVVDSAAEGTSVGEVFDVDREIPIVAGVDSALAKMPEADALVIGAAPPGGELPPSWIAEIETAIEAGCDIVSGLHTFLSDDPGWQSLAQANDVKLVDVRKPPTGEALRVADGQVDDLDATVVLTLGTDCAIGKRTTTYELYTAACERDIDAAWVATGQTGIMVGAHQGAVIDRIPSDFAAGVVESLVTAAGEDREMVFVEGQGSLFHRAYSGVTLSILHGAWPDVVVLSIDPHRDRRAYFEQWPVSSIDDEVEAIERLSSAPVAAISSWDTAATECSLPVANVLDSNGAQRLLDAVHPIR